MGKAEAGPRHLHGVVSVSTPEELAWAKAYVDAFVELSPSKGFGFVDGWHRIGRKFWPGVSGVFVELLHGGSAKKATLTEKRMDSR